MANDKIKGITITGRLKESGITIYYRNGKTVARTATSWQPKRRTRKQFIARQQMLHSTRLWTFLKYAGTPMFPAQPTAYARFLSLMHRTEVVFLPQYGRLDGATMLLPDMPLSEGSLPTVKQHLGEVDGSAALITNLTRNSLHRGDKLILYTLMQDLMGNPMVRISRREVMPDEMTETADGLALISDEFADKMKGWALVHVNGDRCSTQTAVTRCTYYQQFTTEEALQEAAASYGGLTADTWPPQPED
ncbi:MAG: hypothetical protein K6F72_03440 [Bacteroidales bacterium]|nr:hypothetical protein [Bacteroidales bacterium]